jgi:hypothetical protein
MTKRANRGLTYKKVWALIRETDRQRKETDRQMKETDRQMKESARRMEESDRRLKEHMNETDRQLKETMKETSRVVGNLGNKFGKLAEYLVEPNLRKKFNALGYQFTKTSRNIEILDSDKKTSTEIDILFENGDSVIVVEVKSDLTEEHVKRHIGRMEKLRRYWDEHKDKRKLIGAVAGAIMAGQVKAYALNTGFYVAVQSGDTVKIEIPEGFTPRIW